MPSSSRSKVTNSNRNPSVESKELNKLHDTLGSKFSSERNCGLEAMESCSTDKFEHKATLEGIPSPFASEESVRENVETFFGCRDHKSVSKANSVEVQKAHPLFLPKNASYSSENQVSEEDTTTIRSRRRKWSLEERNNFISYSDKDACSFIGALFRLKFHSGYFKNEVTSSCKDVPCLEDFQENEEEKQFLVENIVEAVFPNCLKGVWNQVLTNNCLESIFGSSMECLPKNAEEMWKWTPTRFLTGSIREWQLSFLEHLQASIDELKYTPFHRGRYYRFNWLKDEAFLVNIDKEQAKKCIEELLQQYHIDTIDSLRQATVEDMLLREGYLMPDKSTALIWHPSLKREVKPDSSFLKEFDRLSDSKGFEPEISSERLNVFPKLPQIEMTQQEHIGELKHNHRKGTSCPACHARTTARHRARDTSEVSWKGSSNFILKWLDSVVCKQCEVCFNGINEGLEDSYSSGLIFASCIICGVTVHALCYGVQEYEDVLFASMKGLKRFFLCSPCSEEAFMASCVICSRKGGALKKTEDGNFAHLYCALWTPKVFVKNTQFMEPIVNLEMAKNTSPNGNCVFCSKDNSGITVSCGFPDCSQCFHVYCARDAGQKPFIVSTAEGGYQFLIFCPFHKMSHYHSSSKDDINAVLNTLQPRILKKSKKSSIYSEDRSHEAVLNSKQKIRNDMHSNERNERGMVEAHLRLKKKDWSAAALFKLHNIGKSQLLNFEIIDRQQIDRVVYSFLNPDKNRNTRELCDSDEIWEATQKTIEQEQILFGDHKGTIEKIAGALKHIYNRESSMKTDLKMEKKILMSLKGIQKVRKAVDASRPSCLRHGGVVSVNTAQKRLRELLQDSAAMKEAKEDVLPVDSGPHRRRTQVIRNAAAKNSSSVSPVKLKPVVKEEDNFDFPPDLPQELTACCSVCGSGDCDEIGNDIILCDGCHVAVHQTCYGVRSIPEGDWFCSSCIAVGKTDRNDSEISKSSLGYHYPSSDESVPDSHRCILCPMVGGALKPTNVEGKWAHVSCAMWLPETYFDNPEAMEPIMGSEKVIAERWSLKCSVCNQRNIGPCIQCTLRHCGRAFHVSCGISAGLHMEIKEDPSKGAGVSLQNRLFKEEEKKQRGRQWDRIKSEAKYVKFASISPSISALESEDDISLHLERLKKLYQNLEEVRNLCDLVRKREHLKRGLVLVAFKIYKQHFSENLESLLNGNDDVSEKVALEDSVVQQGENYRQKPLKLRLRGGGFATLCEKRQDNMNDDDSIAETSLTPRASRSGMVGAVAASAAAAVRAAGAAFRLHRKYHE
ncbi:Protein Jade-1 [Galdieria sulphuraria]|nr:Protein Jade-1 [Galdieria sulphuraria]